MATHSKQTLLAELYARKRELEAARDELRLIEQHIKLLEGGQNVQLEFTNELEARKPRGKREGGLPPKGYREAVALAVQDLTDGGKRAGVSPKEVKQYLVQRNALRGLVGPVLFQIAKPAVFHRFHIKKTAEGVYTYAK